MTSAAVIPASTTAPTTDSPSTARSATTPARRTPPPAVAAPALRTLRRGADRAADASGPDAADGRPHRCPRHDRHRGVAQACGAGAPPDPRGARRQAARRAARRASGAAGPAVRASRRRAAAGGASTRADDVAARRPALYRGRRGRGGVPARAAGSRAGRSFRTTDEPRHGGSLRATDRPGSNQRPGPATPASGGASPCGCCDADSAGACRHTVLVGADEGYLLANQQIHAGTRFEALATLFDRSTFSHLREIGVGSGWRCWEVGAGGMSVPLWLADPGRAHRSGAGHRHRHLVAGRPRPRRRSCATTSASRIRPPPSWTSCTPAWC